MNTEIDELCSQFNKTNFEWKPNEEFINDIRLFLEELKLFDNLEVDVYELLVSCGSNLNWSMEYYITVNDLMWFKFEGKKNFIEYINNNIKELKSIIDYNQVINIHNKLCALFELQISDDNDKFNI